MSAGLKDVWRFVIEDVGVTLLRNLERVDLNLRRIRCGRRDGIEGQAKGYLGGVRSLAASSRRVFILEMSGRVELRVEGWCRLEKPGEGRKRRSGGGGGVVGCSLTCVYAKDWRCCGGMKDGQAGDRDAEGDGRS